MIDEVEYLAIGHISRDIPPAGTTAPPMLGGAVSYAGRAAHALGFRVGVLTSAEEGYDYAAALPGIVTRCVPARETTTFCNTYTPHGRRQTIHGRAAPLTLADFPPSWRSTPLVHIAPVADEVDAQFVTAFAPDSLICVAPQGWMRAWDDVGNVVPKTWEHAQMVLSHADVVILSVEDLPDMQLVKQYAAATRRLVLTNGEKGCTLFEAGEIYHIPAPVVTEVNPTGAGDIFAAAFLIALYRTHSSLRAAAFANRIASACVAKSTIDAKMTTIKYVHNNLFKRNAI